MATKKKTNRSKVSSKRVSAKATAKPARAKTTRSKSTSLRAASPSFTVNDIERSLAWYRDVLGFTIGERWEDGGKLLGAEVAAGEVTFMLGQDDWKKGRDRVKGEGFRLYCTTDQDIDRLAADINGRGGALAQEPKDEWGMRSISLADPTGYKITISKTIKS